MIGKRGDLGGARTPEELETLLEDALVIGDGDALATLFEEGATLVASDDRPVRGETIARSALAIWGGDHPYVADLLRVLVARDVALVVGERAINVARRGPDSAWRYVIVLHLEEDGIERGGRRSWIPAGRRWHSDPPRERRSGASAP